MPQVAFCSITLRQLHEILNSEITDKKNKQACCNGPSYWNQ